MKGFILFLLLSSNASAVTSSVTIRLSVKVHPERLLIMILRKDPKLGYRCKAEGVPEHRISVERLSSLMPPFKSTKITPDCEQILNWDKTEICYRRHENPIVDDVIRWCTNI